MHRDGPCEVTFICQPAAHQDTFPKWSSERTKLTLIAADPRYRNNDHQVESHLKNNGLLLGSNSVMDNFHS